MIHVFNKKCIRNLSKKSLKASKTRNIIAVLAIALTTVLFTALFTIAMSINASFQEANFRQVGGFSHGGFKYMTEEQFDELKDDPMIEQYGLRRFLGMPVEPPFNKVHVEIGYSDRNQAHWMYCDPIKGRLPEEGTNEAATDIEVLKLLGVEPKLGEEFSVTFLVDGVETTQKFTLCGWWEKDEIVIANHILVPESRVNQVLRELDVSVPGNDGMTGSYNMDVMFKNAAGIEENLITVLDNHGYQNENKNSDKPFINIGVNWGYTGAQISDSIDPGTAIAMIVMLLLIVFTGYLIIYNVFRISIVGDIRFYGLIKTIGTTGRQIKRIIRQQALMLSLCGIPLGLVLGWLIGSKLTPVVLTTLDGVATDVVSINPWIFIVSAMFALITVLFSCSKPGRMAAKISPVEAVRYTESNVGKKTIRKGKKGISLMHMAMANIGRSKSKTVVTIISLSLAVVLLNATVMFSKGFDMDKYLSEMSVSDFIVADAAYFQTGGDPFSRESSLSEEVISDIKAQGTVRAGGRVYGQTESIDEFIDEDYFRKKESVHNDSEYIEAWIEASEHNQQGKMAAPIQLSGMEPYALDKLNVCKGDISKLYEPGKRYIAAVYYTDDYDNIVKDSHWAEIGDKVTLRYVSEYEYYNPDTGKIYDSNDNIENQRYEKRALKYKDIEYEVAALVEVPSALSYRYYGQDEFVLNDETFIRDTGTSDVMLYAFDTTKKGNSSMEQFLSDYTTKVNPTCDYESKAIYQKEFEGFRSMFVLLGGVLSLIVGIIGILNFFNGILTGIITRKREFAMLQSIGMTGKQMKKMLVYEGLFYALSSIVVALVLSLITGPLASKTLNSMFWFFTYHTTFLPVLLIAPIFIVLGCAVPLVVYRTVSKQTIVERLREAEN